MNKMLQDKVAAIALGTRSWVQSRATSVNLNSRNLMGWCAIGSAELHKRLTAEGIQAEIHMWEGDTGLSHCFVVVDDHVVDITATQFNEFKTQDLVIMHTREAEVFEMYNTSKVFEHTKALRRYQQKQGWPSSQIACT